MNMQNDSSAEYFVLLKLITDIRSAIGDPNGKLMQDELVDYCRKMSAVVETARCIHHWHCREPDGMVVSKDAVFDLWKSLDDLDAVNRGKE